MNVDELRSNLAHFTGTEGYFRHSPALFPKVLLTDGAHFLADQAYAYWLMDIISSHLPSVPKGEFFVLARLQRYSDEGGKNQALFQLMRDLDGDVPIDVYAKQHIPYTDFPLEEIKLYVQGDGEYWVILLPSEY